MAKQLKRSPEHLTAEECEDTVELELSAEQMSRLSRAEAAIAVHSPIPANSPTANSPMSDSPMANSPMSNSLPVPLAARSVATPRKDEPGGWRAITAYVTVASALSGGIAYLATIPPQSVAVGSNAVVRSIATVATGTAAPQAVDNRPVRFTNPFDTTEVFEFPAGTSETEARQAVADLLLQRAHDRQKSWSRISYQRRKTAAQTG